MFFQKRSFFFFLAQMLVYYAHYSGSFRLMQCHRHLSLAAYVDLLPSNSSTVFCCLAVWWFIKHFLSVDIWLMVVFSYLLLQTALVNSFVNLLFLQKSNISGIIGLTLNHVHIHFDGFCQIALHSICSHSQCEAVCSGTSHTFFNIVII